MLDELIKECEKNGYLCLKSLEHINDYGIFIDVEKIYNCPNILQTKLIVLLLASQDNILTNCELDNITFIDVDIKNEESIKNIVNVLNSPREWNYRYVPQNIILTFQKTEHGDNHYKIHKYHLKIKKEFCIELEIRLDDYIVDNTFLVKKDSVSFEQNLVYNIEKNKQNLLRQLERRYSFQSNLEFTNEINDKTKIITIMDKNILRTLSYQTYNTRYAKDCVLINHNMSYFAKNIKKQIPLNHLLALFDIDEKELLITLKKVKAMTNPIVSIGLGGLMSNFFYWCHQFKEYFDLDYLFKQIVVFEYDYLEFSNLPRITLNWKDRTVNRYYRDAIIRNFDRQDRENDRGSYKKIDLKEEILNLSPKVRLKPYKFSNIQLKNAVLIGGPDLDTRLKIYENYAESDLFFLCATHKNNTISIDSFPTFERELVVETYGTLDLNRFLLSMFKTTIELLKILANKEFKNNTFEHLKWKWEDNNFIENSKKHKYLNNIAYAIN